jgi:hypothetical protein
MLPTQSRSTEGRAVFMLDPAAIADAFNPFRAASGLPMLHPPADLVNWSGAQIHERWVGLYSYGLSIYELRQMFGHTDKGRPRFQGGIWDWWLQPRESTWVTRKGRARYCSLSLDGYYGYSTWNEQNEKISSVWGPAAVRASERLLCEAYFASWLVNNWSQSSDGFFWPWCKYSRHWGRSTATNGGRVWAALSYEGIEIGSTAENCKIDPFLRAAICQDS